MEYLGPAPTEPNELATVAYADASGGGGDGGAAYWQLVGAISANGEATITHNLDSTLLDVVLTRSFMPTAEEGGAALTSATPGEANVGIKWSLIPGNNDAIKLQPNVAIAANEFWVSVKVRDTPSDVTGPGAGTLSSPTQGVNSIDLSLSGGTDAGAGLAGVNWYRLGSLIGTTAGSTFQHTGLSAGTEYDGYTAKRFDYLGNLGTVSNTLDNTSTGAPAVVAPIGTAATNRSAASGVAAASVTHASGSNRIAIAAVSVSHAAWIASLSYDTMTVVGSVTGSWTKVTMPSPNPDVGQWFSQASGTVQLFYKLNPTVGAETVTVTFADASITPVAATIAVQQFSGVDQSTPFGTPLTQNADGPISLTVTSATDDYTMFVCGCNDTTVVAGDYNRTLIYVSPTASTAGYNRHTLVGRHPGAATVAHTVSMSGAYAAIGINIRKATV